jgi:prolyl-tRNA synthetase
MAVEGITPRAKDYSQWYLDICSRAELAENSPVKGCMVIRPHGYSIWEKMQRALDDMFKETGHQNAYFPLFIPKSFLSKEAQHIDGFAKECAVVTHYRLKTDPLGRGVVVDPEAKLEEELVIRPTSETIIWYMYKKWIQSYRDLPLLLNQWANVVRWEMRTRVFLRTTEFLWQEGHTAHATDEEAEFECKKMLEIYRKFAEEWMAIPVVAGKKTEPEKFAGAKHTYTIEALMQDGKALQAGTSHHLGQNFAKAFDVTFQTETGTREYVHATSWGVSTRLMGALIMTHSDDQGLIIPPKLAAIQVVVVPIFKKPEEKVKIVEALQRLKAEWKGHFAFHIDERETQTPGFKFAEWELKGIPVRMEIGPRDVENGQVVLVRRDKTRGEEGQKTIVPFAKLCEEIPRLLEDIQANLYKKALENLNKNSFDISTYEELKSQIETKPGFYCGYFAGGAEEEDKIKEELAVTVRCIPFDRQDGVPGKCIYTGKQTTTKVIFAKAY